MEAFTPLTGRLGQLLAETPGAGPRLEFFIEIEFEDGEFDGEDGSPFLRINHLRAPGRSWRSLQNQSWGAGDGQADAGDLDAVILLFRASNPVAIRSLSLGAFDADGRIPVSMQMVADFESEADREGLDEHGIDLEGLALELGPLRISTRLEKQLRGDEDATRAAVAEVIELADYGPLEKVQGGFVFPPQA